MKKLFFTLVAVSVCAASNAKILRVSNVSGSSAPYSTIAAAHDAASTGDTIMVDASPISYGDITLTKRLVVLGPGYWLVENGIVEEGASAATFSNIDSYIEGSVFKGIYMDGITIRGAKTIVSRCYIYNNISIKLGADNCVIHQNYIKGYIKGQKSDTSVTAYHQITNNIIGGNEWRIVENMNNIYFAYNTCLYRGQNVWFNSYMYIYNSTAEHNFTPKGISVDEKSNNSVSDNYIPSIWEPAGNRDYQLKETYVADEGKNYGAFAGSDPYVLSGVPSGPVIQDLIMPATVEIGSTMNVTIKVGVVK